MQLTTDEIVHLPDLVFVQWCEKKFGINRGIYNAIDSWFDRKGMKDILKRRQSIIHFLDNHVHNRFEGEKVKFGHGGLTNYLNHYWDELQLNEVQKKVFVCPK